MKIVFLCGSLEPGRDGVGDYVRRLAVELMHQGHQSGAIALNDNFIERETLGFQQSSSCNLHVLRLPATWSAGKRFEHAKRWIDNFDANWLSLQFVPFSFHPKGLSLSLANRLVLLGKGRSWHIMMHELWVGMNYEAPIKHKALGSIQRLLIKSLIAGLNPKIIHTQTLIYQAQLTKLGFHSNYLPLFSNIPISSESIEVVSQETSESSGGRTISLVLFGAIHPGAPIEEFAREVAHYAQLNRVFVNLVMIGRCGDEQGRWAENWKAVGLPVEMLGEQSPEYVSKTLTNATLGITTTPALLLGKSGTVAAMQEHGLPVLCVARSWNPRGMNKIQQLSKVNIYQPGNFERCLKKGKGMVEDNKVTNVARYLINALLEKA